MFSMPQSKQRKIPEWHRISKPFPSAKHLQLTDTQYDLAYDIFENRRYKVEIYHCDSRHREIRIPCRKGELYPVSDERWGCITNLGFWAKRVYDVVEGHAFPPLSNKAYAKSDLGYEYKGDEIQIHFPPKYIDKLAKELKVYKRRPKERKGRYNFSLHRQ